MKLTDTMIGQGNFIFRWRSYLPLAIVPVAALIFADGFSVAGKFSDAARGRWDIFCMLLSCAGFALRIATVGYVPSLTSGRNTREHHADVLNTTGMYSVVRHPLYVANFLVFLGFCLVLKNAAFVVFAVVAYVLYYERIILAEEQFLESAFGEKFREWASRTPTAIPSLRLWQAPALSFSWRTAILREYHGVLLIGVVFFVLRMIEGVAIQGRAAREVLAASTLQLWIFAASAAFYAVAYVIRKHTSWLSAFGRGP